MRASIEIAAGMPRFDSILVPPGGYGQLDGLDSFISTARGDQEVVAFLNYVFPQAIREGASDIHFIHDRRGFRVRFRVNGILQDRYFLNAEAARDIDLKIRSRCMMQTSDRDTPMDGSFRFSMDDNLVDVRVSIVPNSLGEAIVCRLLDQANAGRKLDDIWMRPEQRMVLEVALGFEEGLILNVGPTGSGKTSTLYACLNYLNHPGIHIVTAEDPVEYALPGANQVAVKHPQRSFSKILRAFLRQDFDVGLVGEIRDEETAKIALAAANTGHLILSTMHTKSTLAAVTRLVDLGAEHYEIGDSIRLIVAQRLLRKLCPHCAQPYRPANEERAAIQAEDGGERVDFDRSFYRAHQPGCEHCHRGYIGRIPVMEMLAGDREVRRAIEAADRAAMRACANDQPQYAPLIAAGLAMSADKLVDFRDAMKINL
jgi:general secretion pathway protein E/MSHA biogenesis protein MshE